MRLSTFGVVRQDYIAVPLLILILILILILGWQRIVDLDEKFLHVAAKDCLQ